MGSPHSSIGGPPSLGTLMAQAGKSAQVGLVHPPQLVVANGEALPRGVGDRIRIIQNVGTLPVKVLISDSELASDNIFHYVLGAGPAADDGYGAGFDFSAIPDRVSVYGVGGDPRVIVTRVSNPKA